ncbi:MAG: TolC family protein, partial [Candidatus Omnitrophica bacterium]|nr:TolC family protein [Candidatus Omnitrophota bacterium]
AKASKEITRSAVLPQITGAASRTTTQQPSGGGTSSGMTSASSAKRKPPTVYEYNISGQQLLFDGFKTSYDLSTAERNIRASQYNYDVTSSNVRVGLRTAYANLLIAQELLTVSEEIEARRRQNLALVKLRYEGGREHKGSLATSEADLAQAVYDVDQARRAIYAAQRQLTKELGRRKFVPIKATGDLEPKSTDSQMPDFEKLAETNPLLRQLIEKKEAAMFGLKSAYASFFPQIYTLGSLGNTNTTWPPDKNQWSAGASLTLPIFDGGNLIASASKAKATLGQNEADERSGRDSVIFTLSDTWIKLEDAIENVSVQRQYLEAAKERARISEAEYAIGLLIYDNWIIIENNLVVAKRSFLSAELNALTAEANWIQAKGGTLDYDEK